MHVLLEQIAPSSLRVGMLAVVFCCGYMDTRIQRAIRAKRAAVSSPKTKVPPVLRVFSDGECGPLRTGIWADARIKKNEDHILGPFSQNNRRIVATFFQVTAMFLGFVSLRKRIVACSPSQSSYPGHCL